MFVSRLHRCTQVWVPEGRRADSSAAAARLPHSDAQGAADPSQTSHAAAEAAPGSSAPARAQVHMRPPAPVAPSAHRSPMQDAARTAHDSPEQRSPATAGLPESESQGWHQHCASAKRPRILDSQTAGATEVFAAPNITFTQDDVPLQARLDALRGTRQLSGPTGGDPDGGGDGGMAAAEPAPPSQPLAQWGSTGQRRQTTRPREPSAGAKAVPANGALAVAQNARAAVALSKGAAVAAQLAPIPVVRLSMQQGSQDVAARIRANAVAALVAEGGAGARARASAQDAQAGGISKASTRVIPASVKPATPSGKQREHATLGAGAPRSPAPAKPNAGQAAQHAAPVAQDARKRGRTPSPAPAVTSKAAAQRVKSVGAATPARTPPRKRNGQATTAVATALATPPTRSARTASAAPVTPKLAGSPSGVRTRSGSGPRWTSDVHATPPAGTAHDAEYSTSPAWRGGGRKIAKAESLARGRQSKGRDAAAHGAGNGEAGPTRSTHAVLALCTEPLSAVGDRHATECSSPDLKRRNGGSSHTACLPVRYILAAQHEPALCVQMHRSAKSRVLVPAQHLHKLARLLRLQQLRVIARPIPPRTRQAPSSRAARPLRPRLPRRKWQRRQTSAVASSHLGVTAAP